MNIREILQEVKMTLGPQGDFLGAELLLAFVLKKDRIYLLAHDDEILTNVDVEKFENLFERMLAGEPVAYLTGNKEFFGMDFLVDKRVLIPRPETEHLVERVLDYCKQWSGSLRILDVGTGSGCIAVSLAKHLPSAQVTAVDISLDALEVAGLNAEKNGVKIQFFQSDLLQSVEGPFDIIVANLPYIGEKRFAFVTRSVSDYEPHLALFAGEDGLELYRKFFEQLLATSWKPKLLLGEFGFLQRDELTALFKKVFTGQEIRFEQDYAHIDRMFVVEWPAIA